MDVIIHDIGILNYKELNASFDIDDYFRYMNNLDLDRVLKNEPKDLSESEVKEIVHRKFASIQKMEFRKEVSPYFSKKISLYDEIPDDLWDDLKKDYDFLSSKGLEILRKKISAKNFLKNLNKEILKELIEEHSEEFKEKVLRVLGKKNLSNTIMYSKRFNPVNKTYKNKFKSKTKLLFDALAEKEKKTNNRKVLEQEERNKPKSKRVFSVIQTVFKKKEKDPFDEFPEGVRVFYNEVCVYFSGIFKNFDKGDERNIRRYLLSENSKHSFDDIIHYLQKKYLVDLKIDKGLKALMKEAKKLNLSEKKEIEDVLEQEKEDIDDLLDVSIENTVDSVQQELDEYLKNPDKITFDLVKKKLEDQGFFVKDNVNKTSRQFQKLNNLEKSRLIEFLMNEKWVFYPKKGLTVNYPIKVLKFGVVGGKAHRMTINCDTNELDNIFEHNHYETTYSSSRKG